MWKPISSRGPVLERLGLPLGIVTAIAGASRGRVEVRGQAGHSGTLPMEMRNDALSAAAEMVLAVETRGPAGARGWWPRWARSPFPAAQ